MVDQYDSLCLAMFTGKGGVGKTTLSCGFARRWAQQFPQEQILLISTDPAHSLADVLLLPVSAQAQPMPDLPNLSVRALDAKQLLEEFKAKYGKVLEMLVERGSFVEGEDLTPAWDMSWPGLDELMGVLEIQRLFREKVVDRVVVDMAPTGHALNLLGLMDFLENLLGALELFQEKHRTISRTFTGRYIDDEADNWLQQMKDDLTAGRQLIQNNSQTGCFVVSIAEQMSWLETQRLVEELQLINIPYTGLFVNRIVSVDSLKSLRIRDLDRYGEQQMMLEKFLSVASEKTLFTIPQLQKQPLGGEALDQLMSEIAVYASVASVPVEPTSSMPLPQKYFPSFSDFIAENRRLIIVGGKGGVGKTTVAASISWAMATKHPEKKIAVISIDPAHSLGDAFGFQLAHEPRQIAHNLSGQEINAEKVLEKFRDDFLWELAEMMSGDSASDSAGGLRLVYGPEAWRKIVSQSLPGMDEMLSVVEIMKRLERGEEDLIILDTAPTGHLLRFLEMPAAMSDWLAWIFKLWIKYQDVLGRMEFMSRLRSLRQRVVEAQKKLKNANHTEFIGVLQAEAAIFAEQGRLSASLEKMGLYQRYLVHNRYEVGEEIIPSIFAGKTVVRLPNLPRSLSPFKRIEWGSDLLF